MCQYFPSSSSPFQISIASDLWSIPLNHQLLSAFGFNVIGVGAPEVAASGHREINPQDQSQQSVLLGWSADRVGLEGETTETRFNRVS